MKIELIEEFSLDASQRESIGQLLAESFTDFPQSRTYSKQSPHWRLLATEGDRLLGHLGLDHRMIGTTTGPARLLGIIDVCVDPSVRGRGIASRLLTRVDELAAEHGIEFLMLFTTDERLYERHGYRRRSNPLRWMKVHEHRTIGIGEEPLEELMVKDVGERPWPEGLVDLLGYQF